MHHGEDIEALAIVVFIYSGIMRICLVVNSTCVRFGKNILYLMTLVFYLGFQKLRDKNYLVDIQMAKVFSVTNIMIFLPYQLLPE